jgi:hypothetical protein
MRIQTNASNKDYGLSASNSFDQPNAFAPQQVGVGVMAV